MKSCWSIRSRNSGQIGTFCAIKCHIVLSPNDPKLTHNTNVVILGTVSKNCWSIRSRKTGQNGYMKSHFWPTLRQPQGFDNPLRQPVLTDSSRFTKQLHLLFRFPTTTVAYGPFTFHVVHFQFLSP